jgi:hypothetical protein
MWSIRKLTLIVSMGAILALGCGSNAQKGVNRGLDKPKPGRADAAVDEQVPKKSNDATK